MQYMAPLARGEQSDPRTAENADCSGFAARLRALGLGACALGAPTSGGEQSASSAKEI